MVIEEGIDKTYVLSWSWRCFTFGTLRLSSLADIQPTALSHCGFKNVKHSRKFHQKSEHIKSIYIHIYIYIYIRISVYKMENVQNVYEFKWQTFSETCRIKSDFHCRGTSWRIWLGTALQAGMPRFRVTMVSLVFLIDIILPAAV